MSTELDQRPTQLAVLEQIAENTKNIGLPPLSGGNPPVAPDVTRGSGAGPSGSS